eukprot:CAMPEP_0172536314 /NCGR_PEP_ID=MMETSP1067-20121228/8100_1 /TAXON_ID=265564 ORGANISM="Thalassiosira punctigera, Strain Tpunct2005C2" /NCGR_SAMPLE_ID=MMETSP1067 /ASSEMBLY_ACC=CAM_ASM_000444 /LENGTH=130 /DNA_ID=CAMNT_0013321365 /DNA_START=439 /DNA_END=831 /DNA_ORIENTATION=-
MTDIVQPILQTRSPPHGNLQLRDLPAKAGLGSTRTNVLVHHRHEFHWEKPFATNRQNGVPSRQDNSHSTRACSQKHRTVSALNAIGKEEARRGFQSESSSQNRREGRGRESSLYETVTSNTARLLREEWN